MKRKREEDDDDPRPQKMRMTEWYTEYSMNQIFNYEAETNHNLAIRYLFPAADLKEAVHDHTYTQLPFTEHWVDHKIQVM